MNYPTNIEPILFTSSQVCAALQISRVTLWRLEKRGLLISVPHLGRRRYSVQAVKKFATVADAKG